MRTLLEKMWKFSGEEAGQKPGDQVRGTEKAKTKKSGEHPFKGRLVGGGESAEPTGNMLGELDQLAKDTVLERSLAERWAAFKEEAFKDTKDNRPARKGSREDRVGKRGHKPQERYKKIKETDTTNPLALDPTELKKAMAATTQLKAATGTTAPAPNLAKALDAASQGKPIDATNAKVLEPMMDIVNKAATDPKLANQFKALAQQSKLIK